jgi:hypothetical protein
MRIEAFARYVLSSESSSVRGLRSASVEASRTVLKDATDNLHKMLEEQVLPLILSWYARCRRDGAMADACTLAAHVAFAYNSVMSHQSENSIEVSSKVQQLHIYALLSSRVFINVHHDFELEPRIALQGQKPQKRAATAADSNPVLGFEPLDVFDLWQRSLSKLMSWLHEHPPLGSEVMENIVRLLSGDDGKGGEDDAGGSGDGLGPALMGRAAGLGMRRPFRPPEPHHCRRGPLAGDRGGRECGGPPPEGRCRGL